MPRPCSTPTTTSAFPTSQARGVMFGFSRSGLSLFIGWPAGHRSRPRPGFRSHSRPVLPTETARRSTRPPSRSVPRSSNTSPRSPTPSPASPSQHPKPPLKTWIPATRSHDPTTESEERSDPHHRARRLQNSPQNRRSRDLSSASVELAEEHLPPLRRASRTGRADARSTWAGRPSGRATKGPRRRPC